MARFETETGEIFYQIEGLSGESAPTLTLLHNFMSSGKQAWGPLLDALSEHFRILLPDMPGHGRSRGFPADFDHRLMAQQIAGLMVAEEADRGHLAGVSSGGMVAQLLVAHELVDPASLTLVSTTYSNRATVTGAERRLRPENFRAGSRWLEATARLHDPHHYSGYFDEVLLDAFRRLDAEQTIDLTLQDLERFRLPVCIIHGDDDEFFPTSIVEAMQSAIRGAELHLIPDQSHALIFRRPWAVGEIFLDFLLQHQRPTHEESVTS